MFQEVSVGVYQHFKGTKYEVLGVGTHTERSNERLVVYRDTSTNEIWVRPVDMFLETVDVDGETKPRFEKI